MHAGVLQPVLRPRFGNTAMYGGDVPMRQLEADARMLAARLVGLAAAALVGAGAIVWRLAAAL